MREIRLGDKNYPQLLAEIKDAPKRIFVRGQIPLEKDYPLAVVGTRRISKYGRRAIEKIVPQLIRAGMTIVSGLALGADSLAHRVAMEEKGKTAAVLASGLDIITPRSHKSLAEQMVEQGGGLVSEYEPGTESYKGNFPARNRIVSGLSLGVLVIEAPAKSGALITAQQAFNQGRKVFAVSGNIFDNNSRGTNNLIKQGARLATGAKDILDAFAIETKERRKEKIKPASKEEKKLLDHLSGQPIHIDKLIELSGLSAQTVSGILTALELNGRVKNTGGGYYIII